MKASPNVEITAVFFDLDGTLFDRDTTVAHLLECQHRAFASELAHVSREDFVTRVAALDDHGYRAKPEVYEALCLEFDLPSSRAALLTADFWDRYHRDCRPFPGLVETLQELSRRGQKLGIITNGSSVVQDGVIDALAIRGLMDAVLVSETEGVKKPGVEIFQRAASRVGIAPAECCYVGDHPDVDIAGARAAGFQAIWKRTAYWAPPAEDVPTIELLPELLSLV